MADALDIVPGVAADAEEEGPDELLYAEGRDANHTPLFWRDYVTYNFLLSNEDPRTRTFLQTFKNAVRLWFNRVRNPIVFVDGSVFTHLKHLKYLTLADTEDEYDDVPEGDPILFDTIVTTLPALKYFHIDLALSFTIRITKPPLSPALKSFKISRHHKAPTIAPAFLQSLKTLHLSHGSSFEWPPEWSDALTNLEVLRLDHQRPMPTISIDRITGLLELRIMGCGIQEFPANLHQLTRLKNIQITDNRRLTSVPHDIGNIWMLHDTAIVFPGHELHLDRNGLPYIPGELYWYMYNRHPYDPDAPPEKQGYRYVVTAKKNPFLVYPIPPRGGTSRVLPPFDARFFGVRDVRYAETGDYVGFARGHDVILSVHAPTSLQTISKQYLLSIISNADKTRYPNPNVPFHDIRAKEAWIARFEIGPDLQQAILKDWRLGIRCMFCGMACLPTSWRIVYGREMPIQRAGSFMLDDPAQFEYSPHVFEGYFDTSTCLRSFFALGDTVERYERSRARQAGIVPAPAVPTHDAKRARV